MAEVRSEAAAMANEILQQHWSGGLPVDPVYIAGALGLEVFNAQLGNDVYGMFLKPPGGSPRIILDEDQPTNRWRFSCAHELGHFVERSGRLEDDDVAFVDKRSNADPTNVNEVYANEFAGNLLMPASDLKARINAGMSPVQIAKEMGVSLDALSYRAHRLALSLK